MLVANLRLRWTVLLLFAVLSPLLSLGFGSAQLSPVTIASCLFDQCPTAMDQLIFFELRLPRILAALLVGGGLAIAGNSLQTVTRNGLADPYLFGVVAGAGLGAALVSVLPQTMSWLPDNAALPTAAFVGASLSVFIVHGLAMSAWARSPEQLLLAGIAISLMLSAATHMVLYLGEPFAANKVMFWLMGSISRIEVWQLWLLLLPVLLVAVVSWLLGRRFDALLMGDDTATSLGVPVARMRLLGLLMCALLTAVVVSQCGGIGFVGLMIPHIVRRWFGVTTRTVVVGCLLMGGGFLVWADTLARSLASDQEIPIGIITSAIGSVFFLLLMRTRRW
ncbi:FecCD family ABC transporter permease [Oceanobacter mangrovi]|uniref:FecCD family ABC transporter permease n=1 Tax=Oceanobacter mangrovi TaxID=2862510 RepID=UPI001C8E62F0|nr:iron ABC transporter permease [Oceanobacter mangrovi]